jgi:hypothetical protein
MVTDATEREAARREREQLVERLQRQHEEMQARSEAFRTQSEAIWRCWRCSGSSCRGQVSRS